MKPSIWFIPLVLAAAVLGSIFISYGLIAVISSLCIGSAIYLGLRCFDRWAPGRFRPPTASSEPITEINGLPLPVDLIDLITAGRWKSPTDRSVIERLFPSEPGVRLELALYRIDYMPFANKNWLNENHPMVLGAPDDERPPGDIDPKRSVLVGDLGLGLDQPIALDYRLSMDEPRILTLKWFEGGRKPRWMVVAPSVRKFAELLGL